MIGSSYIISMRGKGLEGGGRPVSNIATPIQTFESMSGMAHCLGDDPQRIQHSGYRKKSIILGNFLKDF
jgi:hypothetical protein